MYSNSSGYRSLHEDALPVHPTNTFAIASCTKLVTSIAALQCVERGQVSLDEPVFKWLPELEDLPLIKGTPKNFRFEDRKGPITLRHLLTHRSGLGYDSLHPLLIAWRESHGEEPKASKAPITEGFATPLLFEPGQGWQYGSNLDWAGLLIARMNNTTLEEYFQKHIFGPLEMDHTTFHLEQRRDMRRQLVKVYKRKITGGLQQTDPPYPVPPADENGGNGLFSSPYDFTKVLADIIGDSPKLLKRETVDQMFAPQLDEHSAAYQGLMDSHGVFSGMTAALAAGKVNHGLGGLLVMEDLEGIGETNKTLVWGGLCNWVWFMNRELGFAALYASHMLPPAEKESANLEAAFIGEMFRRFSGKKVDSPMTNGHGHA